MRHGILVIAGIVAAACGGDVAGRFGPRGGSRDAGAEGGCETGSERCPCYGNQTCNDGLVCASELCVKLKDAAGDGTAGGGGRSASSGNGGALVPPGVAGTVGVASGGSAGARSGGGAPADGGTIVDGGSTADGGSGGSGGVKGSGGAGGVKESGGAGGIDPGTAGPVALFVMLDRSISMITPPSGQTIDSWTSAVTAITAFVRDPMSKGIDIGLGTFPVGANNTSDCVDGKDCGTPVVPIAPVQTNAQPMIDAMAAQRPQGLALTPTECALRGMINQCLMFQSNSSAGEKCVAVLVTDGVATQCNVDNTMLTPIIADGKTKGVDSFALGLPGADIGVLDQYAAAGGTGMAIDVSAGPQAFIAALNKIRAQVSHTKQP